MVLVASSGPAPDLGFVVMVATFVGLPFAVMGAGALWSALFGRVNSDGAELDADKDGKFSDGNAG